MIGIYSPIYLDIDMKVPAPFFQVAEVRLTYKNKPDIAKRPKIVKSEDAYAVLIKTWDKNKIGFIEETKMLLLNRFNSVLGIYSLGSGGVSGVIVHPKLVFIAALKANASGIILAHNHPSESVKPSREDQAITNQLKEAGRLLTISELDHLVVAPTSYYSFTDDKVYTQKDIALTL